MKHLIGLMLVSLLLVNCGGKKMSSQVLEKGHNISSETPTMPIEETNPLVVTSNNLPVDASDVPDELMKLITTPTSTVGGLLGSLIGAENCSTFSTILTVGGTVLSFFYPIATPFIPMISKLLLNCGASNSSLISLIPGGSSQAEQIFPFLSQVLDMVNGGQNPLALLNGIKNPNDLNAIIGIVGTIVDKTGNDDLSKVLNVFKQFEGMFQGDIGTCGNMNPMACQAFNLINEIRQGKGLAALIPNAACTLASQAHSKDMSLSDVLSHTSSDGTTVKDRLAMFGIVGAFAENIIKGSNLTPEAAVQKWMASSEHAKNILNGAFTSGGIGYIDGIFTQCLTK